MMAELDELICKAIKEMQRARIVYKSGGERIIEPHAFGYDRKGEKKLRAYQIAGYSESGSQGWKTFIVSHIEDFQLDEENFPGPRESYNPRDEMMVHTICMI